MHFINLLLFEFLPFVFSGVLQGGGGTACIHVVVVEMFICM